MSNQPEKNPWKTLASKVIYKNNWISLREDQVITPSGQPGIYGVVDTRVATGVLAINSNKELYLVGQYRYPLQAYSWEIIEGGADQGEDPLVAAKRELKEEAGIVANKWTSLADKFHLSNCFTSEVAYIYLAEDLEFFESSPEDTEILQLRKVSLVEALDMVQSSKITDSLSVIGILLLGRKYNL